MCRFRRFLADEELRDTYLHDQRYTWSSERNLPTLVRIDRVLRSPEWETTHPHSLPRCLSSVTSDHAPLLVDCTPRSPGPRRFYFERFWTTLDSFHHAVSEAWHAAPMDPAPFHRLFTRLKCIMRRLRSWSSRSIGQVATQLPTSSKLIARLDAARDYRHLSPLETWLRSSLKRTYHGLASLDMTIARQRVRLSWLKADDTDVGFLHLRASHRKQKNRILELCVDDSVVADAAGMSKVAFSHLSSLVGVADSRTASIALGAIDAPSFELSSHKSPFTMEEVSHVVCCMPKGKALGPDEFTAEFLCAVWDVVKGDIKEAFHKLHELNGMGFHKLNEAFITLLPKSPDVAALSEYCPISLIHLIAKLVPKVLSLRLAPRLHEPERLHHRPQHPRQLYAGLADRTATTQPSPSVRAP
ncbi:uncharacterized protein [Aegilops tauschii subsp. strangulata]|uniref:uncharacterized protein n=1 Tax=Aegilops tauschii subsp. strangulata TaxID=200361 RepID=UPI003CC892BE